MDLVLFAVALALYLIAAAAFLVHLTSLRPLPRQLALLALAAAFALETVALVLHLAAVGSGAMSSFHEQLSLLAWLIVGVYLALQLRSPLAVLGALVSPLAFL